MIKTVTIVLADDTRDKGKTFKITEMPALAAWKWGIRAMAAMVRGGAEIPDEISKLGMVGVLALGIFRFGHVAWAELEPLFDELLSCVEFVPEPSRPDVTRKLFPGDVEEPATFNRLAQEVFALHTGFFPGDLPSTSAGGGGAPDAAPQ